MLDYFILLTMLFMNTEARNTALHLTRSIQLKTEPNDSL